MYVGTFLATGSDSEAVHAITAMAEINFSLLTSAVSERVKWALYRVVAASCVLHQQFEKAPLLVDAGGLHSHNCTVAGDDERTTN